MEENKNIDFKALMSELSKHLEVMIEDALVDQIEDAVTCAVQDVFEEALSTSLSRFEFVLSDGTVARPKQQMKLLSPDKSKMLLCHGGLRVDGSTLIVQTSTTCWESIAYYTSREEAIDALTRVKNAMLAEATIFEL